MRASPFESLSMNFASPPTKPAHLEQGIIAPRAQNRRFGLDSDRAQLFNTRFRIYAQVAQSVEQRTENPRVGGSIPPLGTIFHLNIASDYYCQQRTGGLSPIMFSFSTMDQKFISE
jgi:hypothetical protein